MRVIIFKDTIRGEVHDLGECGWLWIDFGGEVIGISAENILKSINADMKRRESVLRRIGSKKTG